MRARRVVLTILSILCLLLLAPTIGILVDLTANVSCTTGACLSAKGRCAMIYYAVLVHRGIS